MANVQDRDRPPVQLGEGMGPVVLLLGAVAGVLLVGFGVWFTVRSWEIVTGGLEQWHKNWYWLILCELLIFGGLAVMFGALQVARSEERNNPGMRRLLYGYNAVLSCLLVLTILAHVNVFAYLPVRPFTYAHETYDWSGSRLYSLSPSSQELLATLGKRTKVYVLLPSNDESLPEMRTLLGKCREVNPKIEVEELSPDLSAQAVDDLVKKYQLPEREGVVVVYGPEGEDKYEFIPQSDFALRPLGGMGRPGEKEGLEFKGESALIKTLGFLAEGKERPAIYFTQGNGELELDDLDSSAEDRGLGNLKDRLTRANYKVEGLKLGLGASKVPDDAAVVVVARPTTALPPSAIKALQDYVKPADPKQKKGKLILLFDVVKTRDGQMVHTGLEEFARQELGVQVDDDHVVAARIRDPLEVPAVANPRTRNPVLARLQGIAVSFHDVRTVHEAEHNPANPTGDTHAETLFFALPQYYIWKETNLNRDVAADAQSLLQPDREADLMKKVSREGLPLAVAVTEQGAPADPNDPHAFMHRQQQQTPRAVVFGDTTWVSNARMGDNGMFELFTGSVAWLRDRPDIGDKGTTDTKERKAYAIRPENPGEFYAQVLFVPLTLLAVGIIGLGAGVWVVRRR